MGYHPRILQMLGSLHSWVAQHTSIRIPCCQNGRWYYPLIGEALADEGLEPIREYIYKHHIGMAQYITTSTIFDLDVL